MVREGVSFFPIALPGCTILSVVSIMIVLSFVSVTASGVDESSITDTEILLIIERQDDNDRDILLDKGIPLIAELSPVLIARGPGGDILPSLLSSGYRYLAIDPAAMRQNYYLVTLRPGYSDDELRGHGSIVWQDGFHYVISYPEGQVLPSFYGESPAFRTIRLDRVILRRSVPVDDRFRAFSSESSGRDALIVNPLVEQIVSSMTSSVVVNHLQAVVSAASTRYSTSAGCMTAAAYAFAKFEEWGLNPVYQYHTTNHAPNIIATLPGVLEPEKVFIVIGHLDDMPSSGAAPGANDNASGSATVLASADIMRHYSFRGTIKFLLVTGEEFGLYGSKAYANDAFSRNEDIKAVLNADMNGWAGNGNPVPENLDLNYNSNSQWLVNIFVEAASSYSTGCQINSILCPSMTASDHSPFWSKGWSALCGITDNEGYCGQSGSYPYYHTGNDTIANCGDLTFFIGTVKAYAATLAHLAEPLCTQPQAPSGIIVQPSMANTINLDWQAAAGAADYQVFRQPGGCGSPWPAYMVGETSSTVYFDTTASGNITYGYSIISRDATGYCLSEASACVEAQTSGNCLEPPVFGGISAVQDNHSVPCSMTVSWQASEHVFCGDSVTYSIYRSTEPDFQPTADNLLVACLSGTSWTDHDVSSSQVYTYIVRAEDNAGSGLGPCGGNEDFNQRRLSLSPRGPDSVVFSDDFENGVSAWSISSHWVLNGSTVHGGGFSVWSGNSSSTCATLTMLNAVSLADIDGPRLSFWTSYNLEADYDGVQVQISTDSGQNWQILTPQGGYTGTASATCAAKRGSAVLTGNATTWTERMVDLSSFEDMTILIRFVMMSDSYLNNGGFYLDDVRIAAPTDCDSASGVPTLSCMGFLLVLLGFSALLPRGRRSGTSHQTNR